MVRFKDFVLIGYIISDAIIDGKRESAATRRYKTAGATATHRACDTCIMRLRSSDT